MRIIISSISLASYLHAFDFNGSPILRAGWDNGNLIIESDDYVEKIPCEILDHVIGSRYDQHEVRWDWLEKTLRGIPEQPVVLQVGVNKLNLILSF